MAAFWGIFSYSILVLAVVVGLIIKLVSIIKNKAKLELELVILKQKNTEYVSLSLSLQKQLERYRNQVKALRNELEQSDENLDPNRVADRLERLLSGSMQENNNENGQS